MKITRFLLAGAMMAGLVAATAPAHADDYLTVQSFDGTTIAFHWFPAQGLAPGQTAPTVLQGPGFGGKGQSNPDAPSGGGIPGVGPLRQAGYNVLTWNPRGISPSGGKAQLDNPNFEGRDVQALVNWVATQPEAQLDAPGDPRVGMTGGSYGGGIQFSTAAIDTRIDAIVPVIAWHSLGTALYKASTIKTAWVNLLMTGATQPGNTFDPKILKGRKEAKRGMTFSPEVLDFAKSAGPDAYLSQITAPTLIIQGTIDNLFPLSEAIQNYQALSANGVPVLTGPNIQNFQEIANEFHREGALVFVKDATELARELVSFVTDKARRDEVGGKGRALIEPNRGALGRTVDGLSALIN